MKWVSMAEQPHTSLRSPRAMPRIGWRGVKCPTSLVAECGSNVLTSSGGWGPTLCTFGHVVYLSKEECLLLFSRTVDFLAYITVAI